MKPIYEPKGAAKEYGDYALNIYTGCPHRCFYCVSENTLVLTNEMKAVPIKSINIGDKIIGVNFDGKYYRLATTTVLNKFSSVKEAYLVKLEDGTELICSGDHRWLTKHRGWKYTTGTMNGENRRPYLTTSNEIIGHGKAVCYPTPAETNEYKRGYLCGIIKGDGAIGHYKYKNKAIHGFRLAMNEKVAIDRTKEYLEFFNIDTHFFEFKNGKKRSMPAIRISGNAVSKIESLIEIKNISKEFLRGFMAGFYDAEGSSAAPYRACNTDGNLVVLFERALDVFGFKHKREKFTSGANGNVIIVRLCGGFPEAVRFKQIADIAITGKILHKHNAIKSKSNTRVVFITPLGKKMKMVDITTETGNFIANGCVAHNCYVPQVLHCDREKFHTDIRPRENIIEETRKQLEREKITGKTIHLCFTCDPYPTGYDSTTTREIIKLLKEYGNHVQILTKGDGSRDFDLLDKDDWYGVTIDGKYEYDMYYSKFNTLRIAKTHGFHTWISFEPVVNALNVIDILCHLPYEKADKVKIGKLNYFKPEEEIDWYSFGNIAETICKGIGIDYYIKDSLRKEMKD